MADTTTACLGTLEDLGAMGKPLDVASKIMKAHASMVKGKCRVCGLKMVATIAPSPHGGRRLAVRDAAPLAATALDIGQFGLEPRLQLRFGQLAPQGLDRQRRRGHRVDVGCGCSRRRRAAGA